MSHIAFIQHTWFGWPRNWEFGWDMVYYHDYDEVMLHAVYLGPLGIAVHLLPIEDE